jgi:FG-GAP repeat
MAVRRTVLFPSVAVGLAAAGASLAVGQPCAITPYPSPLAASALDANARYGAAVGIAGNRAIVGAPDEDGGKGAVFIHDFANGAWGSGLRLQAGDGAALDHFGAAVAVEGDWALVGAPDDDDLGVDAGAVYVYRRTIIGQFALWLQNAKLKASDTVTGDRFGAAVALKNGRAVIGAPNDSIVYFHQGSAYAFELAGTTWSQISKLTAAGGQVNENFGSVVAIDGNHALVGAPNWDNVSPSKIDSGRAAVFARITSPSLGWFLDAALVPSDPVTAGRYGSAVALEGVNAFVGASGAHNLAAAATGAAYVYKSIGIGAWQQQAKLLPAASAAGEGAGSGVALAGARALVAGANEVTVYDFAANQWTEKPQLAVPFKDFTSGVATQLGAVVAMTSTHAFVGRPSTGAGDIGTVFPYATCGGAWSVLGGGTLGTGGIPKLRGESALDDLSPFELRLKFGKPNAASILLVRLGAAGNQPFSGGVLAAFPYQLTLSLPLDANGSFALPAVLPAGLVNQSLVFQVLVPDPIANGGVALSNGLVALTP